MIVFSVSVVCSFQYPYSANKPANARSFIQAAYQYCEFECAFIDQRVACACVHVHVHMHVLVCVYAHTHTYTHVSHDMDQDFMQ